MTTMRTRASKGSELTHGELDANFVRDVQIQTTTFSCVVGDNRSVHECNHASTPFTGTLGDAATMAAAETGDYEVTIANIGAAAVTVARAGSDTIDGVATSIILQQYSSVTLKVNAATDGYNTIAGRRGITATDAEINIMDGVTSTTAELNILDGVTSTTAELNILDGVTSTAAELNILDGVTSTAAELNLLDGATLRQIVVDIGDWNMDSTAFINVAHGLTSTNIRSVSALIINDSAAIVFDIDYKSSVPESSSSGIQFTPTNIVLNRGTDGIFDSTSFDSTSYNRGWITIWYV